MIPTIKDIVDGLLNGKFSREQAISWLNTHADNRDPELRDQFAAMALTGLIAEQSHPEASGSHAQVDVLSAKAYEFADAMFVARAQAIRNRVSQ